VLVAEHVQRRKPDTAEQPEMGLRQGSRRSPSAQRWDGRHQVVDSSGHVSFAGTNYCVGNTWRGRPAQLCNVADSVQFSIDGPDCPNAPDPTRPIQGAWCIRHPHGAPPPCHQQDAPAWARVKATPLRDRPSGRALTPTPQPARSAAAPNHPACNQMIM